MGTDWKRRWLGRCERCNEPLARWELEEGCRRCQMVDERLNRLVGLRTRTSREIYATAAGDATATPDDSASAASWS